MHLCLRILYGMANSVDPDQPQEQFDLGLHCLHMPFVSNFGVQNFRTLTIIICIASYIELCFLMFNQLQISQ